LIRKFNLRLFCNTLLTGISGRFSAGQNIAGGQSQLSWEAVVQLFYNESKDFTLGSKHNQLGKVGHFTQVKLSVLKNVVYLSK